MTAGGEVIEYGIDRRAQVLAGYGNVVAAAARPLRPAVVQLPAVHQLHLPIEQKKIRIAGPSVVTANRTWDGAVIYRTAAKGWSTDLSDAAIVRTADEARTLLAESVADDVGAVGAYIAPVEINDTGAIKPGNLREHIRSEGLTIDLPVPA